MGWCPKDVVAWHCAPRTLLVGPNLTKSTCAQCHLLKPHATLSNLPWHIWQPGKLRYRRDRYWHILPDNHANDASDRFNVLTNILQSPQHHL